MNKECSYIRIRRKCDPQTYSLERNEVFCCFIFEKKEAVFPKC